MKRLLLLLAVLGAFAFGAMAQDAAQSGSTSGKTTTSKASKKKSSDMAMSDQGGMSSAKTSTLTGCVSSSAGSDGNYTLSNGKHKSGVSLMPTDKVQAHAGHQVSLKGSWSSDKKSFNVDSVKHLSDTCSTAMGGGTMGKSSKGKKGMKSDAAAPKGF